jgi:hypothetical protein
MKTTIKVLIAAIAVTAVGLALRTYIKARDPLRAKKTETRMVELMGVLDTEQPMRFDDNSLRPILAKYNRLDCLRDGWERPFVIERKKEAGQIRYTIISLGRDGLRGACCRKWVADWDNDAVLAGKEWLQVWYPAAVKREARP